MWDDTPFERIVKESIALVDKEVRELMISGLEASKLYLCQNIYPDINRTEPELTRHDASHIENVFRNLGRIIPEEEQRKLSVHDQ